jgi:iron complex transport system substrate-binding protein
VIDHQWETRLCRAVREPEPPGGRWAEDPRAEAFGLRFTDGRRGSAILGLDLQQVDPQGATDPDLSHAVRCWLAARGRREINLQDENGSDVDVGPFTVAGLGTPPGPWVLRVITLAPSNMEIVEALGCVDRVVACDTNADWPEQIESLERLGPELAPDLDRIEALVPDLVVSSLSVPGMERVVTGLRARGLPQCVLAPRCIDDVLADIRLLGEHLEVCEAAENACAGMAKERAALAAKRPSRSVRVYLEWWPRPMYTPGRDCFSNELVDLAGGINVFGAGNGASVEITVEELVEADPEVCFLSWCGVPESEIDPRDLLEREGLGTLTAVQHRRVFVLDECFAGRPGPRFFEASRRMAAAIRSTGFVG